MKQITISNRDRIELIKQIRMTSAARSHLSAVRTQIVLDRMKREAVK